MKVICVDDEPIMLEHIKMRLEKIPSIDGVCAFSDPLDALAYAERENIDIAFLDIQMPVLSGIELAKKIKKIRPDCSIVFLTGYSEYKSLAMEERCSGYLLKPTSVEEIEMALLYIKSKKKQTVTNRLRVQCFGNFEVFCDERPVRFERNKTKEVFAYLVDRRGAAITAAGICAVVWEDNENEKNAQSYFRKCIVDMKKTFHDLGLDGVVLCERNSYSVNTDLIWCDSYEYVKGNVEAINTYKGEYMSQFSWAESSAAEFAK